MKEFSNYVTDAEKFLAAESTIGRYHGRRPYARDRGGIPASDSSECCTIPQSDMKAKDADGASDRVLVVYQLRLHFHKTQLMDPRRDLVELVSPYLRLGTVGRSREGFS